MKKNLQEDVQLAKQEWDNARRYAKALLHMNYPKATQAVFEAHYKYENYRMAQLLYKLEFGKEFAVLGNESAKGETAND